MQPLHINITRASVAAALAAAASALFPLASPLHTLIGVDQAKTQAVSVVLGAVAAMLAGAGHSILSVSPNAEIPSTNGVVYNATYPTQPAQAPEKASP